jgi:hypothetical protein
MGLRGITALASNPVPSECKAFLLILKGYGLHKVVRFRMVMLAIVRSGPFAARATCCPAPPFFVIRYNRVGKKLRTPLIPLYPDLLFYRKGYPVRKILSHGMLTDRYQPVGPEPGGR